MKRRVIRKMEKGQWFVLAEECDDAWKNVNGKIVPNLRVTVFCLRIRPSVLGRACWLQQKTVKSSKAQTKSRHTLELPLHRSTRAGLQGSASGTMQPGAPAPDKSYLIKKWTVNKTVRSAGSDLTDVPEGDLYMSDRLLRRICTFWILYRLLARNKIVARRFALAYKWRRNKPGTRSNCILVCSITVIDRFISWWYVHATALKPDGSSIQNSPTLTLLTVLLSQETQKISLPLSLSLISHPQQTSSGLPVQSSIFLYFTF